MSLFAIFLVAVVVSTHLHVVCLMLLFSRPYHLYVTGSLECHGSYSLKPWSTSLKPWSTDEKFVVISCPCTCIDPSHSLCLNGHTLLAPVVQTLDSTIYRINHYPADKCLGNQLHYLVDRDLSFG